MHNITFFNFYISIFTLDHDKIWNNGYIERKKCYSSQSGNIANQLNISYPLLFPTIFLWFCCSKTGDAPYWLMAVYADTENNDSFSRVKSLSY